MRQHETSLGPCDNFVASRGGADRCIFCDHESFRHREAVASTTEVHCTQCAAKVEAAPEFWNTRASPISSGEAVAQTGLREPSAVAPAGCHCSTICMAPVVMGRRQPCRRGGTPGEPAPAAPSPTSSEARSQLVERLLAEAPLLRNWHDSFAQWGLTPGNAYPRLISALHYAADMLHRLAHSPSAEGRGI